MTLTFFPFQLAQVRLDDHKNNHRKMKTVSFFVQRLLLSVGPYHVVACNRGDWVDSVRACPGSISFPEAAFLLVSTKDARPLG